MKEEKIEIYRQCMEQRKHYDILSWTIGGAILILEGFILEWTFNQPVPPSNCLGVAIGNIIGIASIVTWLSIYERNRMFVEVANELARDIEREWGIEGIGIRNGKFATGAKVVNFKNIGVDGEPFAQPGEERQKTSSIHFGIRGLMFLVAATNGLGLLLCLIKG